MRAIEELRLLYHQELQEDQGFSECTEWAFRRLEADDEGADLDIVLLAASRDEYERKQLAEAILHRYLGRSVVLDDTAAGKHIVELAARYAEGTTTVADIDRWLSWVYPTLEYPDWLVMLSRNCELATDIDVFLKPFEQALRYISHLWSQSKTLEEFNASYDRNISNSHDFR